MIRKSLFVLALSLSTSTAALAAETPQTQKKPIEAAVSSPAPTVAEKPGPGAKSMTMAVKMPNGDVLNITMVMTKEGYPMQPGPHTVIYRDWSDLEG
ncbi:MAG: hypothetical protein JWM77_526 [Rhodospirillales bacterium]|jgi:hypothetical protein|nr:hypothetical protein [Rhodospirillales bacterium]